MSYLKHFFTLLIISLLLNPVIAQDLQLPLIFSDGMVLQRDTDARIWGWAEAGEEVFVQLKDISRTTKANEEGVWETFLPRQQAGGPYEISILADTSITFKDVYFGDVWIAGGQSNMEWKLEWVVDNWEAEVEDSKNFPEIRFFEVPQAISYSPKQQLPGGEWKVAHPDNAGNFSAVAWHFAKLNSLEKDVPVGIIESNWGGTPAESWTPAKRLLEVEGSEEAATKVLAPDRNWEKEYAENEARQAEKYELIDNPDHGIKAEVHTPNFNDSEWRKIKIPNNEPLSDIVWLRRSFTVDEAEFESANLFSGDILQIAHFYLNGELVGRKGWQKYNERFDLDPSILKKGENTLAFRALNSWDNNVMIGEKNNISLTINGNEKDLTGEWKYSNEIEPKMPEVVRYEWEPGFLYNSMIHPLAGYSIKGAIWYQGESNVGVNQYYNNLFEAMIEEWRTSWNQGDFPFLFVQLANFLEKRNDPLDSDWARLREAQTKSLSLNNTGMAVIIDIGVADDIHPRNKKDVGKRLWLAAEKIAYGKDLIYSGPAYKGHIIEGNKIRLSFNHVGSGLVTKGSDDVLGFAIAGEDETFHWANAEIDGDNVVVWSDEVENPLAVRYAWADNPDVSLYNKEGLPTVPFRTDEW